MNETSKSKSTQSIALDLRWVIGALLIVIVAMLVMWRPWVPSGDRTIEVTGTTTVKAVPDVFAFYPSYQFKNADKNVAIAALTQKSNDVAAKLKELGVAENNIKSDSSGYDYPIYAEDNSKEATYTLQMTATVDNKELAQKVQDYLVTTQPTNALSPLPSFSETKRKELEATARDQATKEAKAQAEQMAKNLGFSVGGVKSVTDSSQIGGIIPYMAREGAAISDSASSLTVHPGENELPYSVTVEYYIR